MVTFDGNRVPTSTGCLIFALSRRLLVRSTKSRPGICSRCTTLLARLKVSGSTPNSFKRRIVSCRRLRWIHFESRGGSSPTTSATRKRLDRVSSPRMMLFMLPVKNRMNASISPLMICSSSQRGICPRMREKLSQARDRQVLRKGTRTRSVQVGDEFCMRVGSKLSLDHWGSEAFAIRRDLFCLHKDAQQRGKCPGPEEWRAITGLIRSHRSGELSPITCTG